MAGARRQPAGERGATGLAMAPTDAAAPIAFAPVRALPFQPTVAAATGRCAGAELDRCGFVGASGTGFTGRCGQPARRRRVAAAYLAALATEIDVGDVAPGDSFDMVLGSGRDLLYAGLDRSGQSTAATGALDRDGRAEWIDAANTERPRRSSRAG